MTNGAIHPSVVAMAARIEAIKAKCILRGMTPGEADALWSRACEESVKGGDPFTIAEAEIARTDQGECAKTLARRKISR